MTRVLVGYRILVRHNLSTRPQLNTFKLEDHLRTHGNVTGQMPLPLAVHAQVTDAQAFSTGQDREGRTQGLLGTDEHDPAVPGVVLPHIIDEVSLLRAFVSWGSRCMFGSLKGGTFHHVFQKLEGRPFREMLLREKSKTWRRHESLHIHSACGAAQTVGLGDWPGDPPAVAAAILRLSPTATRRPQSSF